MIEGVVFDLDGTLVNLPIDYENLFRELKRIIKADNIHPLLETISVVDEDRLKQIFRAWDEAELAVSRWITVNEEGIKTYREFSNKPRALITLQGKKVVKIIIKQLGLSFDFIITREDSLSRVEQLKKAAENLNIQHKKLLFVGNTKNDSAAAEKLGTQFLKIE